MNALGIMVDSWGKKDVAEVACEKILAAEKAAIELEKAQAALAAAQAAAEKAKLAVEEAVHNLPPCELVTSEECVTAPTPSQSIETEDARIARIVTETLVSLGVVPQTNPKQAPAATAPAIPAQEVTVEKSAEELTLSAVPVAGPSSSKGGNYPAAKQTKQRR